MGLIIASIANFFLPLNFFEYFFIVFCAFGPDFDFVFRNYAKSGNHRNFITHSIFIPLIIIIIGIIIDIFITKSFLFINNPQIFWIGGISYLSHLLIDLLDWGLDIFHNQKTYGLYLLITQEEKNLAKPLTIIERETKKDAFFFVKRYYKTPVIVTIDIIICTIGFLCVFAFATIYWYAPIGMFLALEYHLHQKKKSEDLEEDKERDDEYEDD